MNKETRNPESKELEENGKISDVTYTVALVLLVTSFLLIFGTLMFLTLRYYRHPLEKAIKKADIEGIKKAIANGANVNAISNLSGDTMLVTACRYGEYDKKLRETRDLWLQRIYEMVKILIDAGADVNAAHRAQCTPLNFVLVGGVYDNFLGGHKIHKDLVAMLIANGADVNTKDVWGRTPLHHALRISTPVYPRGKLEIVELFIKSGADINARDKKGKTPLRLAIERNQKEIAALLRQHGAKE